MLRKDLARGSAHVVQVGVPELEHGLPFEPTVADKEAVDYAGLLVFVQGGFFGSLDDFMGYDGRIGFSDLPFFQLTGYYLLDLVLEAQCDLCDVGGGEGGGWYVRAVRREHWRDWALAGEEFEVNGELKGVR